MRSSISGLQYMQMIIIISLLAHSISSFSIQLQSKRLDIINGTIGDDIRRSISGSPNGNDVNDKYHKDYTIYYQEKKPNITVKLQDTHVLRDGPVYFVCTSIGNPVPRIKWLVNEKDILPRRYSVSNISPQKSILRLNAAETSDNRSKITCQSMSLMGSAFSHAFLNVYKSRTDLPNGFPMLTSKSSVIVNEKNSRVILDCYVNGVPNPNITWFKDAMPVDLENPRLKLHGSGSLEINKSLEEDDGTYECMASNKHGSIVSQAIRLMIREDIEATYRLIMKTVSYFAPRFIKVPKDHTVSPGSSLTLICKALGNPTPFVYWKCGQTVLRPSTPNATNEKGESTVVLSDLSESMRCTCVAKNTKESIEHSILVSIHEFSNTPLSIQLTKITGNSVTVSWLPKDNVDENIIYKVSVLKTTHLLTGKNTTIEVLVSKIATSDQYINTIVPGLLPHTNYSVYVETKYPLTEHIQSNTLSFVTLELSPSSAPKNVELSAISNIAVAVMWEPPDESNGVITAYNIYYTMYPNKALSLWNKYTLKIKDGDISKGRTSILSHLLNNVTYYICVSAQNSAGSGPVTESYPILVKAGVVQGPKQLRAVPKSTTEIKLFWQPIVPIMQINILSYNLLYTIKSEPSHKVKKEWKYSPEQNNLLISNLQPNTTYSIYLSAVTSSGNGMVSSVEATTYDIETQEPIHLVERVINSTAIEVSWVHSGYKRRKVLYYRIQCLRGFPNNTVSDRNIMEKFVTNVSAVTGSGKVSYTFSTLKPNTPYQFYLNVITLSGSGTIFKSKMVSTWPYKIPKLKFLHLRLTCAIQHPCVELSWKSAEDQRHWINGYRIRFYQLDAANRTFKVVERNVTTSYYQTLSSDHYQGFRYEFRVAPFSKYEVGEESISQIIILEGTPSTFPSEFQMKDLAQNNPTSVLFTWNKMSPQNINGKFNYYQLKCQIVAEERGIEMFFSTQEEYMIVKNLSENKNYGCSVRVWNSNSAGPWSSGIFFKTKDAYLLPPENIRMIRLSQSTAFVTWKWKIEFPIYYSHFLVYYADEKSRSNLDTWSVKSTKSIFTKFVLTSLNSTVLYVIRLASVSKRGIEGPLSEIVKEISLGPESRPEKLVHQASCAAETSSNIQLRWSAEFETTDLSHFRVNFTGVTQFNSKNKQISLIRNEEEQSANKQSKNPYTTHQLQNLRPNTRYTISIEPIFEPNSIHIGGSIQVQCMTLKEPPASMPELSLDAIDKGNIHLLLHRPNSENGSIDVYYIIVTDKISAHSYNSTRQKRSTDNYLEYLLYKTVNSPTSNTPYIALSLKGDEIFPLERPERNTYRITIGSGETVENITNKLLNGSLDYQLQILACIRLINFQKQTLKCTHSVWSKTININKSSSAKKNSPFEGQSSSNKGPSTFTMTTVVIILSVIILAVLSISVFIIIKRRYKLKSKLGVMYGSHSTRISKEKTLCMDNLLKEPLVDPALGLSASESTMFCHRGNNYVDINKLQLSSTPDLLVRSSMSHPVTSVALFHGPSGRNCDRLPVHVDDFGDHVSKLKENDGKPFCLEYESIEPGQQFTWNISSLEVNRPKNRYANVVAYDHCRVLLQHLLKRKNSYSNETIFVPGSDYINANYIDGYLKTNAYIATQGPLSDTIGDFWRMVWEQNSSVIVMMTRLEERDRAKCDQYWPVGGKGSIGTYSNINVTIIDTTELAYYTIRKFYIQKFGSLDGRNVCQLQFTAWPDHGVPNHPAPLLMFLRRVQAENPRNAGPMVVHCSAGVGRTGAFIVIDYMLERLHYENTLDIYNYITRIRAQRNYMVQTEEQYIFIHEGLLEAVMCGNTEVSASELDNHIETLNQIVITHRTADGIQMTGLQMEYEKLILCSQGFMQAPKMNANSHSLCSTPTTSLPNSSITSQPLTFDTANSTVNQMKNRIIQMLPPDFSRVHLCPIRGVEGSDYINASWIDGYKCRKAYIAAQSPLVNTCEDFWRMLWEHNSSIVIMLTRQRENNRERSYQYWPTQNSVCYQYFIVDAVAEYNMSTFLIREFKITDTRDSQSRVIRQFQYIDWREGEGIPESTTALLDVIQQVHKTKSQLGLDGPITVHCSAGTARTGIFIALSNILDRMKNESVVDLFQTVKFLRWQRPALIQSEDQYQFCYNATLEYLKIYEQMHFD